MSVACQTWPMPLAADGGHVVVLSGLQCAGSSLTTMPLSPGTRLRPNAFQAPLGAGGMGEVYKARDTRLDRTVTIKVLPEQFAADPTLKQRFEREAQTVAALNHPHICTLYDIGRAIPQGPHPGPLPDGEGGDGHAATRHEATHPVFVDFLVMEHLEGETLMDRVARGPIPFTEAMPLALTLLVTLKVLHEQDVVHRDLKPANLFLTAQGLKLLDFGLARAVQRELDETNLALTSPDALVGTPQYMAPEALQGQAVYLRADLFAVGAVLYEMLAGRPAFIGGSLIDVAHAVILTAPPVLTGSPAVVAIDRVINRALAKRPEDRYQTAGSMSVQRCTETGDAPVCRGATREIPAVCDRGATQAGGMQRRSNAAGLSPRAARWTRRAAVKTIRRGG